MISQDTSEPERESECNAGLGGFNGFMNQILHGIRLNVSGKA